MAARSLPVLTHPTFPQVLDALMGREVQRVEKILGLCCWESPESQCTEEARIDGLCARHYRQVQRG